MSSDHDMPPASIPEEVFFPWVTAKGRHQFVKMFRYDTFTGDKYIEPKDL